MYLTVAHAESYFFECRWFGVIIYAIFLFLVIVVLLNLLIAQMSDTYGSVQQDAQRSLAINRALIVARVEHNSLLARVSTTCPTILDYKLVNGLLMCLSFVIPVIGFQKVFL